VFPKTNPPDDSRLGRLTDHRPSWLKRREVRITGKTATISGRSCRLPSWLRSSRRGSPWFRNWRVVQLPGRHRLLHSPRSIDFRSFVVASRSPQRGWSIGMRTYKKRGVPPSAQAPTSSRAAENFGYNRGATRPVVAGLSGVHPSGTQRSGVPPLTSSRRLNESVFFSGA
jgi:hypothetical protein